MEEQEYEDQDEGQFPESPADNQQSDELIQIPEPEEIAESISEDDMSLMSEGREPQRSPRKSKSDREDNRLRLHQERTRNYQLAQERMALEQQLEAERQSFQQQLDHERKARKTATEAANYFLEASHDEKIKRSDAAIKQALDVGDNDAAEKAREEKTTAQIDKAEAERWRREQQMAQPEAEEPQYANEQQQSQQGLSQNPHDANPQLANEWANDNSWWINERSPQYNPEFMGQFDSWLTGYQSWMMENGMGNQIGSPEYYGVLQDRVDEAFQEMSRGAPQQQQNRREPQMRQVRRGVAPVRGGQSNPYSQQRNPDGVFKDQRARDFFNGLNKQGQANGRWDQVKPEAFQREYQKALQKIQQRAGL